MRIITGQFKGRKISVPDDSGVRPTSDRVKESIFSIIDARKHIAGCRILDLFAGSGNLSFEAISRGAAHAVCVETSLVAVDQMNKTAMQLEVEDQVTIIGTSTEDFLRAGTSSCFDLVFADPPYEYPYIPELPDQILKEGWLKPDGWFILEHDKRHLFHDHPHLAFTKPYGRTIVSIFTLE